jgi:ABC-type phosphate transport system substrate-binding protein/archaellin
VVLPLASFAALALLVVAVLASASDAAVGQLESWGKFGFGSAAEFSKPSIVGVDSNTGSVFAGDETEDHTGYRIQKLSPTGTVQGTVTIPRFLDLPTPHEKPVALWGVAVDSSAHRFYVLEGGKQLAEGASGEFIAKKILVFSTEPEGGKLVAPSGGPSSLTLPTSETEALYKPLGIAVDPGTHDVLVMAEGPGSPKHIVIQRFNSSTGASINRFEDTANKLKPSLKSAISFAVAPSGKVYSVTGRPDKVGKANTRLWELPSNLSSVAEVPGFATAFDAEEISFGVEDKIASQLTGGPQLAISPSGKTIYWKERVEAPEEKIPGNFLVRGYSLTENATAQVYGGAESTTTCRITSGGAAFGVTGEGAGEKVVVFDFGPPPGAGEPGTVPEVAPPYGDKVLTFGQGGSGCPVPVAKFKANGTEGNIKVAKGTTVTFDASPSVLTSGPKSTAGFRKELIWKFGDGTEQVVTGVSGGEAALTTSHTYNSGGNFEATLQIHLKTPNYGNPALVSHKVEVEGSGATEFELKVTKNGTGSGVVTGPGINCGSECSKKYPEGTVVTLTGTPNAGSKAVNWESCPGTVNGSNQCEVTMTSNKEAKATFNATPSFQLKVVKNGTGSGTVTSAPAGINCGTECTANFAEGTVVKLTGSPEPGSKAVVWQTCPGTINGSNQCEVTMSAAKEAKATFDLEQFQLKVTKKGTGSGTVTSTPAGINCGTECEAPFNSGTVVKLTGAPTGGSKAVAWSGCDSVNGSNECVVTMSSAKEVEATFDLVPSFLLKVVKNGTGSGGVTSAPTGINCGTECSKSYAEGTVVTLTGTPNAGSKAVNWESCPGTVNGSNQCEVTMSAAKEAKAMFTLEQFQLKVAKKGSGSGTVSSAPAGINCGSECEAAFNTGTVVKLTGAPAAGSKAVVWNHCDSVNGSNECVVTMSAAKEVEATFDLIPQFQLKVVKNGTGSGTVTSAPAGINCGGECQANFAEGTVVTLTGTPDAGSKAVVWQSCPGTINGSNQCEVTMSAAKEAKATFTLEQFQLKVAKKGTGSGTVTSAPAGINCGTECEATFNTGTVVKLTGAPAAGSKTVVWNGCDSVNGSNECVVTMSAAKEVEATFDLVPLFQLKVVKNGTGSGTVTSLPAGIDCGSECQASFAEGTVVALTGTPNAGSKAVVWQSCPGTVNGSNQCVVTMSAAKEAKATFDLVQFSLKVVKNGSGSGIVTSSPAGINCGSECEAAFNTGTLVKLTGASTGGSKAVAWSGCDSVNGSNECVVTMSAAKEVEATFDVVGQFQLKVSKNGSGSGTVTSSPAGINCGSECAANFAEGTVVKLSGTPDAGSKALVWQTCPGIVNGSNECVVTLNESTEAVATFDSETQLLKVTKNGSGLGTVTSSPAGIDCGSECQASFVAGTEVKLTGTPNAGSKAVAWNHCDSVNGSNECVVTMSAAKEVEATFELEVTPPVGCNGSDIVGEGSTAQGAAQGKVWIPGFQGPGGLCNGKGTEPKVSYEATGSGAGLAAWDFNGPDGTPFDKTRAFTASDDGPRLDQLENAEAAAGSPVVVIPVAQTAITVAVNPPANCTVTEITNKQLEEIFRGTLKRWGQLGSQYAIGSGCSGAAITRVVRADGSGTTYQLKTYLGTIDTAPLACTEGKTWQQLAPIGAGGTPNTVWPENGKGGCGPKALSTVVAAPGNGGSSLVAKVNATAGSIGYAALPTLEAGKEGGTHWVKLQNNGNAQAAPTFAEPAEGNSANCLEAQYLVPLNAQVGQSGLHADWSRTFGSNNNIGGTAYPLCTLTYDMALTKYGAAGFSAGTEETVEDYLTQYVTAGSGQEALKEAADFYAPLPTSTKPKRDVYGAAQLAAGEIGF